jgi:hypothetical protein
VGQVSIKELALYGEFPFCEPILPPLRLLL